MNLSQGRGKSTSRYQTNAKMWILKNHWRVAACCLLLAGCSDSGLKTRTVFGSVSCGGEPVPQGHVRFVPIEGTSGPAGTGTIADGQYRIDARGGVPLGKHRVEIVAQKTTGRKVPGFILMEPGEVDEIVTLGPPEYEGQRSPLVEEVTADSDGRFDFEIPANPGGPRPGNRPIR